MTALTAALAALLSSGLGAWANQGPESLSASAGSAFLSAADGAAFAPLRFAPRPAPVRPAWLKVEGEGAEFAAGEARFLESFAMVARTSSGEALSRPLVSGRGKVVVRQQGMWVTDRDAEFTAGLDFLLRREPAVLAPILAHELEHLVQLDLGLSGAQARPARELAAFFVQCRPWVELGAPVEELDWPRNGSNSRDMWAWLDHPFTAATALAYRGGLRLDLAAPKAAAYWRKTLADEKAWRKAWVDRFPKARDSQEAALFVLEQAAGFSAVSLAGPVSAGLPDLIEAAAALAPGESLVVPFEPSAKDRALLEAAPISAKLSRRGSFWILAVDGQH
ncbi:MAG: hypothetical protein HY924_16795 [Elusimicrobia bacterium]|nr:hypothetical protein [Elusimicrobiota bacterium]